MAFDLPEQNRMISGQMQTMGYRPNPNAGVAAAGVSKVAEGLAGITQTIYNERKKAAYAGYDVMAESIMYEMEDAYKKAPDIKSLDNITQNTLNRLKDMGKDGGEFFENYWKDRGATLANGINASLAKGKIAKNTELFKIDMDKTLNTTAAAAATARTPEDLNRYLTEGQQLIENNQFLSPKEKYATYQNYQKIFKDKYESNIYNLINADPMSAIDLLNKDGLVNKEGFTLDGEKIKAMKSAALSGIKRQKEVRGWQEILDKNGNANAMLQKYNEQGLSQDEIANADISDSAKQAFMILCGYDSVAFKQQQKTEQLLAKTISLDTEYNATFTDYGTLKAGKTLGDVAKLRDDAFELVKYGASAGTVQKYMAKISNVFDKEVSKAIKTNKPDIKDAVNPYAAGLKVMDFLLNKRGINDTNFRNKIFDVYTEALAKQLKEFNPGDIPFNELDIDTRNKILGGAKEYALAQVPTLTQEQTNNIEKGLPAYKRPEVMDAFLKEYNSDMTADEQNNSINTIITDKQKEVKAETDMALDNAIYKFTNEDNKLLEEFSFTQSDVIATAQRRGISVIEVLGKLYEKRDTNNAR